MTGNLFDVLRAGHLGIAEKQFIVAQDRSAITFGEFDATTSRFAAALRACRVGAGDRVVAQNVKSPEGVALYMATLQVGAIYVPLNPAYTGVETARFVADAQPALYVGSETREDVASQTLLPAGGGTLAEMAASIDPLSDVTPRLDSDVAALIYTSGTTGEPKGAMLTHGCLATNAAGLYEAWGWQRDDVLLHVLPVFHVHGLFVALNLALLGGSTVRFLPRFDVSEVRRLMPGSTVMMGVPTFYSRLLDDQGFSAGECRTMRLFVSGSAPLAPQVHASFAARSGHTILERYGMSEAGMICSNPLDGARMAGTVGYPIAGYEVRIDGDEIGELQVRGPSLFAGYWNMQDKTSESITKDGWFRTGDIASIAPDGRVTLHGRNSDMIISGGFNVYPKEVELVIDQVEGVVESAVVGVPDPDLGERPVAFVVGDSDEDVIRGHVASQVTGYKRPVRYVFVPELPRNAMGKVQKAVLRASMAAETP